MSQLPSPTPTALFNSSLPYTYSSSDSSLVPPLPPLIKRRFEWDDLFFEAGNEERENGAKNFKYDINDIVKQRNSSEAEYEEADPVVHEFECDISGCHLLFTSFASFDAHYHLCHTYKCEICTLKLPNNRLLELHIQERHDELFRVMAKTKKMYACLVEGCSGKFRTRKTRQLHLVAKHSYPPNFTYDRRFVRKGAAADKHRRKDKPHREEEADKWNQHMTHTEETQTHTDATTPSSSAASSSSSSAAAASTPAPRPPVVSRTHVLSFIPRAVRSATAAAASSSLLPQRKLPTSTLTPAFTHIRQQKDDVSMRTDEEEKNKDTLLSHIAALQDDADEDDATAAAGMDVDSSVDTGLSRLHVSHSLPKKLTFGAMNRRHG